MTYSCFRIIGWKVHFTVEDHWNVKVVDCFKLWSWRKLKNSWWFTTHFAVFIFFRHIATGGYSTTKMTATMCNQLVMKLGHLQTERAGCLTLEQPAGFTTTCNWPQTAKQFNAIRCRSLVFSWSHKCCQPIFPLVWLGQVNPDKSSTACTTACSGEKCSDTCH